ncbi:MAG: hypothetical protein CM1200mP2_47870 [Planctomycetaceae bacterium]|nr:MAG: hypothetical protein CM1200mP2_47870 [Planctomycetaceae bacterium]
MAALTSNPTVLNVTQVLEARLVIEARGLDAGDQVQVGTGLCLRSARPSPEKTHRLEPRRGHRHPGVQGSCLVPLSPGGDGNWVVPGCHFLDKGKTRSIPMIYPANDTTRTRLKQILKRGKRQILDRPSIPTPLRAGTAR